MRPGIYYIRIVKNKTGLIFGLIYYNFRNVLITAYWFSWSDKIQINVLYFQASAQTKKTYVKRKL